MTLIAYLRGATGLCPHCGKGPMFRGLILTHDHCSHCGLQFEGKPGDFTGASVLSYSVTSAIALAFGLAAVVLTEWPLMTIILIGFALIFVLSIITYRPLKGLWIAFLVDYGWLPLPIDSNGPL